MTNFPEITSDQVVLLRARSSTGIALDEDFNVSISERQRIYTIFDNLNVAKEYIEKANGIINDIDFTVFDKDHSIVLYLRYPSI